MIASQSATPIGQPESAVCQPVKSEAQASSSVGQLEKKITVEVSSGKKIRRIEV